MLKLRSSLPLAILLGALVGSNPPAGADQEFHSVRLPLFAIGAPGHPVLNSGHVIDIHSDGDRVAGHELYMVNGAAPLTPYSVVLDLNFGGCGAPGPVVPFANGVVVTTDDHGNGTGSVFLNQGQLDGVAGMTLGITWRLVVHPTIVFDQGLMLPLAVSGTTAYTTQTCIPVFIDDNQNGQP